MISLFRTGSVQGTQTCFRYAMPIGKLNVTPTKGYVYCCDVWESEWNFHEIFEFRFSNAKKELVG